MLPILFLNQNSWKHFACGLVFTKIFYQNFFLIENVIIMTSRPHFSENDENVLDVS